MRTPLRVGSVRGLVGNLQPWGVVDQAFSSITNLGVSIVAARLLGASGLGVVFVGFSAYLFALAAQRAFVTDPLTVHAAPLEPEAASVAVEHGVVTALLGAVSMTAVVTIVGFAAGGRFGHGILLFTPWIFGALLQDFWRAALFRAGRGSAAACNDGVWVAVMGASLPLALWFRSDWLIVGTWGLGASAGAVLGWYQMGMKPRVRTWVPRLARTWAWWRRDVLPLGWWLAFESMCIAIAGLVVPYVIVTVLSPEALGGLRAVDTVFAPMTLLSQGLELPWLPQLSRQWARSTPRARRMARRPSALAVALLVPYLVVVLAFRGQLLGLVFGPSFRPFAPLVFPVAASEVAIACTTGYVILLKAAGRGRARLAARAVSTGSAMLLVSVLTVTKGLLWATWGRTLGVGAGALVATWLALRADGRAVVRWEILPADGSSLPVMADAEKLSLPTATGGAEGWSE